MQNHFLDPGKGLIHCIIFIVVRLPIERNSPTPPSVLATIFVKKESEGKSKILELLPEQEARGHLLTVTCSRNIFLRGEFPLLREISSNFLRVHTMSYA